ncbi:glycoside hydrolase family protein [Echinicola marina]|uniref:glycoside hydrolase family protein n=1 Tax=Echinicola marina TaxID=2859768 RepID=UPI001CF678EA|nr:glycoside hydrolase family protein [Echinicola marina]UCS92015.1 glycoside hydrolase family protein [Echinicola marina]
MMTINNKVFGAFMVLILLSGIKANAQIEERPKPPEWNNLVEGGRFLDLFKPIDPVGKLVNEIWGEEGVVPRYIDNGIEDGEWSYWGGNIMQTEDGKYHLFVCRWREDAPKGHMEWPNSIVVHAVADNSIGPFKVINTIGKGHNPEIYKTKEGSYIIYVIDGYYIADNLNGPWHYDKFEFDPRDRPIIEGLSNLTFAQREDGSYLMVCRGGGVWFSKDGISTFNQVSNERVYPPVEGRFEDPVVWKDHVQYHLIVNDWLGRIAFYLRSKDGINWKTDPGEAYMPGITQYTDGTKEDWFKYERIKILQDELGRAVQANFAVIDYLKHEDKPNDKHSSKNIGIPLTVGRQLTILNKKEINAKTKSIEVLVKSEEGFNAQTDMDLSSLHFGASEEVNYGHGCRLKSSRPSGQDLILVFEGEGNGFKEDNFAGKLLGKDKEGNLLFGFARLPWVNYLEAALSAKLPRIDQNMLSVEVQNFGQSRSMKSTLSVKYLDDDGYEEIGKTIVPELEPFEKRTIQIPIKEKLLNGGKIKVQVMISSDGQTSDILTGEIPAK